MIGNPVPDVEWFHDITILAVWSVFVSTIVQAITHLVACVVLHNQHDQTNVGVILKRRELSLGVKNLVRSVYDGIILVAITWGVSFQDDDILMIELTALMAATWVAVYYAIRFVLVLHRERWGRDPDATRNIL